MQLADRLTLPDFTVNAPVIILAGQSLSAALDCGGLRARGVLLPGVWTAAALSMQASVDGTNYFNVFTNQSVTGYGWPVSIALVNSLLMFTGVANDLWKAFPFRFLKFLSGTPALPVVQVAQATLSVYLGAEV